MQRRHFIAPFPRGSLVAFPFGGKATVNIRVQLFCRYKFQFTWIHSRNPPTICQVNNPSVHRVNVCHYDWFNKQADWPTAEQGKVR